MTDTDHDSIARAARIHVDGVIIDVVGHRVLVNGRKIHFPYREFQLLRFLAENRGVVFTRMELIERIWQRGYDGGTRTVDIHVRRVRRRLAELSGLIETVRQIGYKMLGADEVGAVAGVSSSRLAPAA